MRADIQKLVVSGIVLAVVPMSVLNPMGRPAFLGYYLGVLTMWLTFVVAARLRSS